MSWRVVAVILGVLALSACSVFGGPAAPEPDHEVVRSDPPFEVRAYPALAIVSTPMGNGMGEGTSGAFQRLFDYISGENAGSREIAMTAPVLQQPAEGQEIAMTAPVIRQPAEGGWEMIFVLPSEMTAETAPKPTDPAVTLGTIEARRVAVVRFSGLMGSEKVETQRSKLLDWIESQGLAPAGGAEVAGYDPPWTLPWFRRNEVLIPVAGTGG